jgi:hypothetical protein
MKEIMEALNIQIDGFEIKENHYANVDDANRLIKALGGTYEVKPMSSTDSVCVYITALALRKMFEEAGK